MIRPAWTAAAALTLLLGLGGCITLFPKEAPAAQGGPISVRVAAVDFDAAASGDRILTVDGDQVAYIGGGRWESPASQLFEESVWHAFNTAGGRTRLVGPGPGKAEYRLIIEVSRFEARYLSGPTAAPTVVVHLHASLTRQSDLSVVADKEFDATAPASDNRVGPIVEAYDQATTQAVGDMVAWVNQPGG
jgi:cholesterol transport system auxiliary component